MRPAEIPGLTCRPARTLDEIHALLALQAEVYAARGFIDNPMCDQLQDRWVGQSIYFGAFQSEKPVGVSRLIPYSADFHCFDIFDIDARWQSQFEGMDLERCAYEVSALSVPKDAPGDDHSVSAALFRAMVHFSLRDQRTIWFAGVTPFLARLLNRRLGIPLEVIGPAIDYMGGWRMPIMIDLTVGLRRTKERHPAEWEYFTSGLEIDLRDGSVPLVDIPERINFAEIVAARAGR